MFFNVRVYKQHDTDILMLLDAGFPVAKMITKALYAYAHGEPLFFLTEGLSYRNIGDTKCTRVRLELTDKDTIHMFCSITNGYKNVFCKTVLRNALIQQNVNCFFKQESDTVYQQKDYEIRKTPSYPGLEIVNPDTKIIMDISGITKTVRKKRTDNKETGATTVTSPKEIRPVEPVVAHDTTERTVTHNPDPVPIATPEKAQETVIHTNTVSADHAVPDTTPEDSDDIMSMFDKM